MDLVPGCRIVDPSDLAEYERGMEEAIPEMLAEVQMRQELARRRCTPGLVALELRVSELESALGTEREMHKAWRKRAEESEAVLLRLGEVAARLQSTQRELEAARRPSG